MLFSVFAAAFVSAGPSFAAVSFGEVPLDAAIREVREETGCEAEGDGFAGETRYEVEGIPKIVMFWRMRLVRQTPLEENDEITEAIWMPLPEAIRRMTYQSERELVARSLASRRA